MNKKGFTVVELLVSLTLSFVVLGILFETVILLKNIYTNIAFEMSLLNKENLISEKINNDLNSKEIYGFSKCDDKDLTTCINIIYASDSYPYYEDVKLNISKEENLIEYGDYATYIPKDSSLDNLEIYLNSINIADLSTNSCSIYNIDQCYKILEDDVIFIKVPIFSINNEQYDINIMHQYKGVAKVIFADSTVKYYKSINDAFSSARNGSTVFLLRNASATDSIIVDEGTNLVLNLNNYSITLNEEIDNMLIFNSGNLKIIGNGNIISNVVTESPLIANTGNLEIDITENNNQPNIVAPNFVLANDETGTIKVTSGIIESSCGSVVLLNNSNVRGENPAILMNGGSLVSKKESYCSSEEAIGVGTGIGIYNTSGDIILNNAKVQVNTLNTNIGIFNEASESNSISVMNDSTIHVSCSVVNNPLDITFVGIGSTGGDINITGGKVVVEDCNSDVSTSGIQLLNAKLNMSSGEIISKSSAEADGISSRTDSNAVINIMGGEITTIGSEATSIEIEDSELTLDGVKINSSSLTNDLASGIRSSNSNINITGNTTITALEGIFNNNSTINITDGLINSTITGIENNSGVVNISSGSIYNNDATHPCLANKGTINITGGLINSKLSTTISNLGVDGVVNIGTNDNNIAVDKPEIIGKTYALDTSNGLINFYDGVLSGETGIYNGVKPNIPNGTELLINESNSKKTAILSNN